MYLFHCWVDRWPILPVPKAGLQLVTLRLSVVLSTNWAIVAPYVHASIMLHTVLSTHILYHMSVQVSCCSQHYQLTYYATCPSKSHAAHSIINSQTIPHVHPNLMLYISLSTHTLYHMSIRLSCCTHHYQLTYYTTCPSKYHAAHIIINSLTTPHVNPRHYKLIDYWRFSVAQNIFQYKHVKKHTTIPTYQQLFRYYLLWIINTVTSLKYTLQIARSHREQQIYNDKRKIYLP